MPKNAAETYEIVQKTLDESLKKHDKSRIDFVHDEEAAIDIVNRNENAFAIIMPAIGKSDIFEYVAQDKVLPRKSFSMGRATEKRYYLEAKKIA